MADWKDDRLIAIHEAAHTVVAYRHNLYLGTVTIVPTETTLGSSTSEGPWGNGEMDREQIVVLFAGLAAELHTNPNADPRGGGQDEEEAAELLRFQPDGSERELRTEVVRLVTENWEAIVTLAEALMEFRTLPEDEAGIIIDAVDEVKDWREILAE